MFIGWLVEGLHKLFAGATRTDIHAIILQITPKLRTAASEYSRRKEYEEDV